MAGAAAGLGAVLPAQSLFELHPQYPSEPLPGEAAGLLQADEARGKSAGRPPLRQGRSQPPMSGLPGYAGRRGELSDVIILSQLEKFMKVM